jgi:hypothetical protein
MPSDLEEKLLRHSPDTSFERFAKNFRNMGVVDRFEEGGTDGYLVVVTDKRGMNVDPVRDKGHDFEVVDTRILTDGEPEIRHLLRYKEKDNDV